MASEILINYSLRESRIARLENGQLVEIHIERSRDRGLVGNIYKGRVTRVLPGMQAAFVDIGLARTAFLYVSNILDPNSDPSTQEENDEEELENEKDPAHTWNDSEENIEIPPAQQHISELVREGETLLVQVIKEPMGTKGARLTGYVSIPGRFLVYLPDTRHIGISRRIEKPEEKTRLKQIVEKNRPSQGGFIIRTVAEGASEKNLKDDMDYLVKLWGNVKKNAQKQTKPGLIYADLDLTMKILRDRVTDDVERIVVDNLQAHKQITKFIQTFLPRYKKRIELHSEKTALFEHHGLESEITRAISRKVWLKSGGYIIIDQTEALTSVDVNTGRFVGRRNLEETILQTNLEAVKEIAYQIRLRNLGGIIVLDFIDMIRTQHRDRIYQALLEELKRDPVKTNVLPISEFGLIEMTRKRTQESLRHRMTSGCQACDGRGYIKSTLTTAYQILRDCEKESAMDQGGQALALYCHPSIAAFFAEDDRAAVEELEKKTGRRLMIKVDPNLRSEEYEIFTREA
jgi:ribonuclease G